MAKPRSPSPLSSGEISSDNEEKAISKNASRIKDSRVNPSDRDAYAKHFKGGNDEYTYRRKHDIYFHFREDDEHPPLSHFRSRTGSRSPSRSPWRPGKLTRKEQQELDEKRFGHFFKTPEHVKALKKEALKKEQEKSNMPEKRERTGDHYNRSDNSDPRRFKVHYEDSAPRSRPLQQYGDTGRAPLPKEHMDREASMKESDSFIHPDRQAYHNPQSHSRNHQQHERDRGRRRHRSRSPLRHDNVNSFSGSKDRYRNRHGSESDTEHGYKGSKLQESSSSKHAMLKSEDGMDKSSATRSDVAATKSTAEVSSSKAEAEQGQVDEIRPQLSEAEQIEQRRKMREAIRAKHRNNAPLLVQALEQNMPSAPATPIHDSSGRASEQQSPTSAASPGTPHQDSPPGSPAAFVVNDDEELADRRNVDDAANEDDGPSAADYDPNFDMQEDRPDHKRLDMQELAGVNQPLPEQDPASKQKEFDMFAEDDDDDMFAPVDKTVKPSTGGTIQTRTLDASLLDNWDYPDGHYRIILGELLDGRYAVQQQIGKGTFATVIRAQDTRTGQHVAVKIACNNQTMYKAGQKEMDMLRLLNEEDVEDKKHIIRLHRHFDHKGHLCIVFENLSADLREVLKKFGRNVGLNLRAIRSYAQQMFMALSHLKTCKILHADLKPDNILVSEKRSLLKVCDLGTATFARDAEITPYLVSRFYRAPEVILGVEIDYAIDMWSIGCTLFELYTGRILFAGADNNQMLRVIQECRGKIPNRILKRSALVDKHFDIDGNFISQEHDKLTGKATIRQINFNKIAPGKDLRARLSGNIKDMKPEEAKEHAAFVDLMDKCLQLDPARRISPNEALRHKFITHSEKAEKSSVKLAMNVPRKA